MITVVLMLLEKLRTILAIQDAFGMSNTSFIRIQSLSWEDHSLLDKNKPIHIGLSVDNDENTEFDVYQQDNSGYDTVILSGVGRNPQDLHLETLDIALLRNDFKKELNCDHPQSSHFSVTNTFYKDDANEATLLLQASTSAPGFIRNFKHHFINESTSNIQGIANDILNENIDSPCSYSLSLERVYARKYPPNKIWVSVKYSITPNNGAIRIVSHIVDNHGRSLIN